MKNESRSKWRVCPIHGVVPVNHIKVGPNGETVCLECFNNSGQSVPLREETQQELLSAKEVTHGNYVQLCYISRGIKAQLHASPSWEMMDVDVKESLEMIAVKIARILNGDSKHLDHWDDIAGYAELVASRLRSNQ